MRFSLCRKCTQLNWGTVAIQTEVGVKLGQLIEFGSKYEKFVKGNSC